MKQYSIVFLSVFKKGGNLFGGNVMNTPIFSAGPTLMVFFSIYTIEKKYLHRMIPIGGSILCLST